MSKINKKTIRLGFVAILVVCFLATMIHARLNPGNDADSLKGDVMGDTEIIDESSDTEENEENTDTEEGSGENENVDEESNDSVIISSCSDLQKISQDLAGEYVLAHDIDCVESKTWDVCDHDFDSLTDDEACGFISIGGLDDPFIGKLDGKGYRISNLYINRPGHDKIGLFKLIDGATIENFFIEKSIVAGNLQTGTIVGHMLNDSRLKNVIVNDTYVIGVDRTGGLVGQLEDGKIIQSSFSGEISGFGNFIGGIVGSSTEGEILDALTRNIIINTRQAVKMRTRAGMGFCQGKFCGPRVDEIIKRMKN